MQHHLSLGFSRLPLCSLIITVLLLDSAKSFESADGAYSHSTISLRCRNDLFSFILFLRSSLVNAYQTINESLTMIAHHTLGFSIVNQLMRLNSISGQWLHFWKLYDKTTMIELLLELKNREKAEEPDLSAADVCKCKSRLIANYSASRSMANAF